MSLFEWSIIAACIALMITTVMHSTVLVCMTPVWVGLFEWQVQRKPLGSGFWSGLVASLAGIALMSTDEGGNTSVIGDALAVFAGLLAMGFVLIGRDVRRRVDIGSYGGWLAAADGRSWADWCASGERRIR